MQNDCNGVHGALANVRGVERLWRGGLVAARGGERIGIGGSE